MNATQTLRQPPPWTAPDARSFRIMATQSTFIDEVFSSRQLLDTNDAPQPLDVYIPPPQGDLLYSLVRFLKPVRTLEVGLANGISALFIAQALQDNGSGRHLAIDPFQSSDWRNLGLQTLRRAGLDHLVRLDPRPSHWSVPDLDEAGERVQFAFVDGSHLLDYVMTDFMTIDRVLDVGGMIAFDDSDWPPVNHVIRFALANRDYEVFATDIVIEPSPGKPRWPAKWLRSIVRKSTRLRKIVRNDFTFPSTELNIDGRCVVLRKLADDSRHCLRRQLVDF